MQPAFPPPQMQPVPGAQPAGMTLHYANIICCQCGTSIPPNPSNMCANCLRQRIDITEGIPRQLVLQFCRACDRYLQPPNVWLKCELESRELLALCLKKLKGLSKVRLVDAKFMWTEPHSRRVIVRLTVQKEAYGAIMQQDFDVTYTVRTCMCDQCQRESAKDTWNACIQLRQKVDHKRTFLHLEQLILKHRAHQDTLRIDEQTDGLDFYFSQRNHAVKFGQFLQDVVPLRSKEAERLYSSDCHNNTYNFKYSFSVELVPICKNDLVCLPPRIASQMGNISPVCLCWKVTKQLHLIDTQTLRSADVQSALYWRAPFGALCSADQLTEFTVVQVEPTDVQWGKWLVADVQVVTRDNRVVHCRSHLGRLLKPGDTVLGYDIANSNFNDQNFDSLRKLHVQRLPDVILVRKHYPMTDSRRRARRAWKLDTLPKETAEEAAPRQRAIEERKNKDMEDLMREVEEDPEMRQDVVLHMNPELTPEDAAATLAAAAAKKTASAGPRMLVKEGEDDDGDDDDDDEEEEDDLPMIQLGDLIDDLRIKDEVEDGDAPAASSSAAGPPGGDVADLTSRMVEMGGQ